MSEIFVLLKVPYYQRNHELSDCLIVIINIINTYLQEMEFLCHRSICYIQFALYFCLFSSHVCTLASGLSMHIALTLTYSDILIFACYYLYIFFSVVYITLMLGY